MDRTTLLAKRSALSRYLGRRPWSWVGGRAIQGAQEASTGQGAAWAFLRAWSFLDTETLRPSV